MRLIICLLVLFVPVLGWGGSNFYSNDGDIIFSGSVLYSSDEHSVLAEMFPKTADYLLVKRYLGGQIPNNAASKILFSGKEKELLKEAERQHEERVRLSKRKEALNEFLSK